MINLQVLGLEVHSINSVEFSNHTGYGFWKGNVLNSSELSNKHKLFAVDCKLIQHLSVEDLMTGLETNKLDEFSHILTGYVGSASFLEELSTSIQQLKRKNPDVVFGKYFNT